MRISIVTISYNQSNFLEQAIVSVLDQDYHDIEYIIVDPGSTDGSRKIIGLYENRISKIILESDDGPADGLNKGFACATGRIFGFLNSDDVLEPGALNDVVKFFLKNPHVDVVSGHSWIIDSEGVTSRKFYSDIYSPWMAARGASILSQASTFFRATAYQKTKGFNIKNIIAWDGELFADLAMNGAKFSRMNKTWSKFRIHGAGITGSRKFNCERSEYEDMIFEKITGREINHFDKFSIFLAKLARKILNPMDTFERIYRGPINKVKN